ncbi:putative nucleotidyltransferase [Rhizobium pisi]|uniref:Putative nucleotidyltransferase n=1 Tax=Rhizobium pisi TaxID=574561 RepID=A0A7W5BI59_9HYPH|nr:putative nucleotidyltransferase [Rhizobium pisi]
MKDGTAEFKKRGRILKIILFGSYAKGGWVDEPFTMKGYRSDFDLLIIVNNRKLLPIPSSGLRHIRTGLILLRR